MQTIRAVGVLVAGLLSSGLLVLAVCGHASSPPAEAPQPSAQPPHSQSSTKREAPAESLAVQPEPDQPATIPALFDPEFLRLLEHDPYDPGGYPRAWLAPDERPKNP